MRIKDIKAGNLFSVSGKLKLLVLLCCVVFPPFLSAQIYQSGDAQIYVNKETVITQNFSQKKIDSARIYIVTGTLVTGLQPNQNIAFKYSEKSEKTKIHVAKNHSKTQKYLVQHTAKEEKPTLQKESIRESKHENTFLFSAHHSSAVAPTTIQNIKLLAFFPKKAKAIITTKSTFRNLNFEKNNLFATSVCLKANSIRPPPIHKT